MINRNNITTERAVLCFFCLYRVDMQFSACYSGKATLYMAAYIIELTKRNFRCSLHCISFHVLFWKNC